MCAPPSFEVCILGPTAVTRDGVRVPLRPRERALVAAVALRRPATTDDLVDLLWPGDPPATARKAVQNHVVRVRRATAPEFLETEADGYTFGATVVLDTDRVVAALRDAAEAFRERDHERRRALLQTIVSETRGVPFADLPASRSADAARQRFIGIICEAEDALAEARLALGEVARAANELTRLLEEQPTRESRWWLLMLAQYRMGRRREALATAQRARRVLAGEAGLEPGDELRRLERLIIADDPMLLTSAILVAHDDSGTDTVGAAEEEFVGRTAELGVLADRFDAACAGRPGLVSIEGEAGIGKTALARRFAADALGRGARVVWGTCDAAPATPLQPFAHALEELAEALGPRFGALLPPDPAPLAALSPALEALLPTSSSPPDPGRYRLREAVTGLLRAAASQRPLVVILDDLHLAPPVTQRLARDCLAPGARLLVLATRRVGPGHDPFPTADSGGVPIERIELAGLSVSEVATYLGTHAHARSELDAVATWMVEQTGGNPLFVRELTRALVDREAFVHLAREGMDAGWSSGGLPDELGTVVEDRLAGLGADTLAVLRAAAVLGTRFRVEDLAAMVDRPARALDESIRAGIVRPARTTDELEFTHELFRRVIYESLPAGTRVELHDLAAAVTAAGDVDGRRTSTVAIHQLGAVALDPNRAVAGARRAADRALAAYAYEEAAELYLAALEAAQRHRVADARTECELLIVRGDALRRAGDPDNVAVLLDAAERADELGDGELLGEAALALCQLGPTTASGGSDERAAALAARALERARDPRLRAAVAGAASLVHSMEGDHEHSRGYYELAEREARRVGDARGLAQVLPYAYLALGLPSDLDRRARIADEVAELGGRLADQAVEWEALQLHFSVLLQRGDPRLYDVQQELAELTAVLREPTRMWTSRYLAAAVAHLRGDLEAAEAELAASLEFQDAVSPSRVLAVYGAQLLGIRLDQHRLGELADAVEGLLAEQPGLPAWHAAMALVASETGDADRVCREFDRLASDGFAALPGDFARGAALYALARAVAATGDPRRAQLVYDQLLPAAGLMSWMGTGTYGPVDLALGACARAAGNEDAARKHLTVADGISTRLDAPVWRDEARRALSASGSRHPGRRA